MAAFLIWRVIQWLFLLTVLNWRDVHAMTTYYMDDHCGGTIYVTADAMKLKLTSRYRYPREWNCTLTIRATKSDMLMYFFKSFDVDSDCDDFLVVYDDTYGDCYANEYKCHNSKCIYESNTCNGYNPCGDYSDCDLRGGAIAGIVIATVAVVTATIVTIICCVKRRRNAIKRQNVHVPVQTSYPTGQNVIQTHASDASIYMYYAGVQVNSPGYSNQVYSETMSTYPPTMLPSNPPPYSEHKISK